MSNVSTLSPDGGLTPDISISDLGKLVGGEAITPAAQPEKKAAPAPEPPKEETKPAEAAAVTTPAAEPEKKPEAEEIPADKQQVTEQPTEETPEEKRKKGWVDERLSSLSSQRRAAEAGRREEQHKREEAERKAEQLQRELETLKAGNPGPSQQAAEPKPAEVADAEPTLKSFTGALKDGEEYEDGVERYVKAHAAWARKQDSDAAVKQQRTDTLKAQQEVFQKDWRDALGKHPDFEDAVAAVRQDTPAGIQEAISQLRNDDGTALWPEVVMHLYEHRDEAAALAAQYQKNPVAAIAKLGAIVAKLSAPVVVQPPKPAQQAAAPAPKPAPTPPAIVGGQQGPAPVDLEKADMNTFAREVVKYL